MAGQPPPGYKAGMVSQPHPQRSALAFVSLSSHWHWRASVLEAMWQHTAERRTAEPGCTPHRDGPLPRASAGPRVWAAGLQPGGNNRPCLRSRGHSPACTAGCCSAALLLLCCRTRRGWAWCHRRTPSTPRRRAASGTPTTSLWAAVTTVSAAAEGAGERGLRPACAPTMPLKRVRSGRVAWRYTGAVLVRSVSAAVRCLTLLRTRGAADRPSPRS